MALHELHSNSQRVEGILAQGWSCSAPAGLVPLCLPTGGCPVVSVGAWAVRLCSATLWGPWGHLLLPVRVHVVWPGTSGPCARARCQGRQGGTGTTGPGHLGTGASVC